MQKRFLFISFLFTMAATFGQELPYGSNKGRYASANGTKIYYEEYGEGAPLLLLHGGFGTIRDFEKCIGDLSKRYRVIAADSPGHGRSPLIDAMTYEILAGHFSAFIDELKLDSLYVIGWSDGGVIALTLAAARSDKVKKVIAAGVNYRMDGMDQSSIDFTKALTVDNVEAAVKDNEWLRKWLANYQELSGSKESWKSYIPKVKALWMTEQYLPEQKIKSIGIPVMLVYGDHDIIRLEHALSLYRMMKNSQLAILPNATHAVFTEYPQGMNSLADTFFHATAAKDH